MASILTKTSFEEIEVEWNLAKEQLTLARRVADTARGAISHAYYAIFHAMTAALLTKNIATQSHSGAALKFTLRFVKTGLMPRVWSRKILQLYEWRVNADYSRIAKVTPQQSKQAIAEAAEFLRIVEHLVFPKEKR